MSAALACRERDYIIVTPPPHRGPTVALIKAMVAEYYDIPPIDMVSDRRSREVARPRQVAMYLANRLTTQSTPAIGRYLGGRDHTTVMHGIRNIERLRLVDTDIADDIDALVDRLSA